MRTKIYLYIFLSFVYIHTKLSAFNNQDSLKVSKPPRHYFNSTIYLDGYATGKRTLNQNNLIGQKLKTYQVSQLVLGFSFPVATKDFYNKDSTRISNIHLLVAGSHMAVNPYFDGIPNHQLSKTAMNFRGIYNNGKKSIFFVEFSPFVTRDNGYSYTTKFWLATTLLYNCAVNEYFSFRVGITRSFLWGNRNTLPYIGIRVGKLDRVNFSIQFPRSITFNVPIGKYIRTSLYTKPQGGLYFFSNTDSFPGFSNYNKLYFGRYEFLYGLRIDILPSKYFNFYLSSGLTAKNTVRFSGPTSKDMYHEPIKGTMFFNFGLVIRFGKTKSIYNNRQMYNAIDLNNSIDPGDNNTKTGNGNIPLPNNKMKSLKPTEVVDLIETQDLY